MEAAAAGRCFRLPAGPSRISRPGIACRPVAGLGSPHARHAACTPLPLRAGLMAGDTARPSGGNVTGDDLIVAAPWLVFAAGMAVIGWQLAAVRRHHRLRRPPRPCPGAPSDQDGAAPPASGSGPPGR